MVEFLNNICRKHCFYVNSCYSNDNIIKCEDEKNYSMKMQVYISMLT